MIFQILQAFMLGVLIDILYIAWIWSANSNRYAIGVISSVAISACSLFGFINVYDDRWLAIPYLLGLAVGTIIGIFIKKRVDCEAPEGKDGPSQSTR